MREPAPVDDSTPGSRVHRARQPVSEYPIDDLVAVVRRLIELARQCWDDVPFRTFMIIYLLVTLMLIIGLINGLDPNWWSPAGSVVW